MFKPGDRVYFNWDGKKGNATVLGIAKHNARYIVVQPENGDGWTLDNRHKDIFFNKYNKTGRGWNVLNDPKFLKPIEGQFISSIRDFLIDETPFYNFKASIKEYLSHG